jgi:hypothetical protein
MQSYNRAAAPDVLCLHTGFGFKSFVAGRSGLVALAMGSRITD